MSLQCNFDNNVFMGVIFTYLQLDGVQKDIDVEDEPDFYQEAPLPG